MIKSAIHALDLAGNRDALAEAVINTAMDAIIMIDRQHCIRLYNKAAEDVFGYPVDEVIGQHLNLLIPAQYHEAHEQYLQAFAESSIHGRRMAERGTVYGRRHNGEAFPIEASISRIETDKEVFYTAILRDITERIIIEAELQKANESLEQRVSERTHDLVEANQQLIKSQARLREAQRIARMGHWEMDLQTHELYWSEGIYAIFEIEPAEFDPSYQMFLNQVHPQDRDLVDQTYQHSIKVRQPYEIQHRLQMPDGRIKYVLEQCVHHYNDQGQPVRSIGTVQDISERVHVQQKIAAANEQKHMAEQASKAKTTFLSNMSHELRTPMNAILGFAQVLQMQLQQHDAQRTSVDEIYKAGMHLLHLIDDLLDLSHIEADRVRLQIQCVDVAQTINEAISYVGVGIRQREIRLNTELQAITEQYAHVDAAKLRQVVINLLSNAVKYNRIGGEISIIAKSITSDSMCIDFEDSGEGIDHARLAQLFIPFERLGAEDRSIEGSGIGLSLSKKLMEMMSGDIELVTTSRQGSTFRLVIPLAVYDSESAQDACAG